MKIFHEIEIGNIIYLITSEPKFTYFVHFTSYHGMNPAMHQFCKLLCMDIHHCVFHSKMIMTADKMNDDCITSVFGLRENAYFGEEINEQWYPERQNLQFSSFILLPFIIVFVYGVRCMCLCNNANHNQNENKHDPFSLKIPDINFQHGKWNCFCSDVGTICVP